MARALRRAPKLFRREANWEGYLNLRRISACLGNRSSMPCCFCNAEGQARVRFRRPPGRRTDR